MSQSRQNKNFYIRNLAIRELTMAKTENEKIKAEMKLYDITQKIKLDNGKVESFIGMYKLFMDTYIEKLGIDKKDAEKFRCSEDWGRIYVKKIDYVVEHYYEEIKCEMCGCERRCREMVICDVCGKIMDSECFWNHVFDHEDDRCNTCNDYVRKYH
jgi:hypothetical protein